MPDNPETHSVTCDETTHPTGDTEQGDLMAQPLTATTGTYGCARCPNRWGGLRTAHCAACHNTFTGLTAFDRHRTGSHTHGTRTCLDPETAVDTNPKSDQFGELIFKRTGRSYPCWGFAVGDDRWADDDE